MRVEIEVNKVESKSTTSYSFVTFIIIIHTKGHELNGMENEPKNKQMRNIIHYITITLFIALHHINCETELNLNWK